MSSRHFSFARATGVSRGFSLKRTDSSDDEREPVIALINVVFLLMIFFIVTGVLARRDGLPMQPPSSTSKQIPASERLELDLLADGKVLVAGEVTSVGQLLQVLGRRTDAATDVTSRDDPRGELIDVVQIRADATLPAGRLAPVLDALRQAGARDVRLLTRQP